MPVSRILRLLSTMTLLVVHASSSPQVIPEQEVIWIECVKSQWTLRQRVPLPLYFCVPAVMTEVMESPDVIQLLVLRALSLARKVALSWVPGVATGPFLALILSCRGFPRAGYDPSAQHSCPVSVTIPARLHSSSSMGLRLGTPQPLLLPVACGGLGHLCNSPILCPEAAF